MPPALSDQESSGDEQIPPQKKGKQKAQPEPAQDEEEDEESGLSEEPDEYVVEKIIAHKFVKSELVFHVKWQGYDSLQDHTWEPEANMEGAIDVMNEYFDEIGGRPEPKGNKRKAQPSGIKSESGTPASSVKRAKQEKAWSPPPGSWEHDVHHVDTVEQSWDHRTGQLAKFAYLVWNNDKKTQHPLKHVYQKCPQKMLLYYEDHLVFTTPQETDANGGDDTMQDA